MTSQNQTQTAQQQGTHQWVITLEKPGRVSGSWYGAYTPPAGATRHDVFTVLKSGIEAENPELAGATVIFFALEPNQL
ncbi:hypothetical protein CP981_17540 [Streptomyces platensis]|uniref:Uncharacterized protein n=1 Tax=Streptomyces platensis TaxID=58346 RepID=A0AAE6NIA0_STRPT|nr:hypothetical protein [Streptomyces platensis]OSY46083.1 hypothetical protein BG653_02583 [Streptomyces platensis]QEV53232.1 hypothetical protein CP981_17540 [Streptomyces platensis]